MKTKNNNKFGLILAITLILSFVNLGAFAAEAKAEKPERPDRPGEGKRVDVKELKEIIKNFQEQKKQFLTQQKEQQADSRAKVREDISGSGSVRDAKDAINEAKRVSREQARKLAEEAKESAKGGRSRE